MKEGFRDIQDILKEVGGEEGLNLAEMRDLWKHQKRYINKKQEDEATFAIFIPTIGTLSLNTTIDNLTIVNGKDIYLDETNGIILENVVATNFKLNATDISSNSVTVTSDVIITADSIVNKDDSSLLSASNLTVNNAREGAKTLSRDTT